MNASSARRLAPALLLLMAAALGGLRSAAAWCAFALAVAGWTSFSAGLSFAGRRAALLFFAWTGLAALFSPAPAASAVAFARLAAVGLVFFSASDEEGDGWLLAVAGLGALAAAVFAAQRLSGARVVGFIGENPNYSAAFCAAAFPLAALRLSRPGSARRRAAWGALLALLAAGLWISGSRGAALAAFAAASAGLAAERRWRWLAGLLLSAAALAALLPQAALGSALKFDDPRAFERPRIWGAALSAALARPFFGWGPGLFAGAFNAFKFPFFDGLSYYGHYTLHAHSEPLNIAAEAGLPAAALFLAAAASALVAGGRERLEFKLCALAALLQGCADMVFYSGTVALLFWGSLAFAAGRRGAGGRTAGRLIAAGCLAALVAAALPRRSPDRFLEASYAGAAGNPALALAAADLRLRASPRDAFACAGRGAALYAAAGAAAAEPDLRRAVALEPSYAGARLALAASLYERGLTAGACAALSAAAPSAAPENVYQRALLAGWPAVRAREKEICPKKKAGCATAYAPRTR